MDELAAVPGVAARPIRVLLVDDTKDIRELLRLTLELQGEFDVVGEAEDGLQAIAEVARLRPDLVLLDLAMPVMDGLEALPEIRVQAPEARVLVLSGFNARQMGAEAVRLGASGYMEKGGIVDKLAPRIRELFPERLSVASTSRAPIVAVVPPIATVASEAEETSPEALISLLAHELMNPITVLQGFAMTLQRPALPPEVIERSAEAITRAAKHLGSLVQAFADLRKIDEDGLELLLEQADLSDLVEDCVSDAVELTQGHPVIVRAQSDVVARIDPTHIRQIIINLVSNAAKFSPVGARIDVTIEASQSWVEIGVRDYGPGIPADKMSQLFRKFSRLSTQAPGTGLGLYISRGLARAHGGDLVLSSSAGTGCRFVLRLPVVSDGRLAQADEAAPGLHGLERRLR